MQVGGHLGALLERMRSARSAVSDRTSRMTHGAKMTPSTTATATAASSTSRAALSEPVAWRKASRRRSWHDAESGPRHVRRAWRGRGAWLGAIGGARRAAASVGPPPSDWRQISAPPAAISTDGQTIASENQMPISRNVEQDRQQQQAGAERDLDARPVPAQRSGQPVPRSLPPGARCPGEHVDRYAEATRQRAAMKPTRTISGSIPTSRARPAQTPATYPPAGSR